MKEKKIKSYSCLCTSRMLKYLNQIFYISQTPANQKLIKLTEADFTQNRRSSPKHLPVPRIITSVRKSLLRTTPVGWDLDVYRSSILAVSADRKFRGGTAEGAPARPAARSKGERRSFSAARSSRITTNNDRWAPVLSSFPCKSMPKLRGPSPGSLLARPCASAILGGSRAPNESSCFTGTFVTPLPTAARVTGSSADVSKSMLYCPSNRQSYLLTYPPPRAPRRRLSPPGGI